MTIKMCAAVEYRDPATFELVHEDRRWWRNFILSLGDEVTVERVLDELAKWNARRVSEPGKYIEIEFDNEEDATMFVLRWS